MKVGKNTKIFALTAAVIAFFGLIVYEPSKEASCAETSKPTRLSMVCGFYTTGPHADDKNFLPFYMMKKFNERAKGKYEIYLMGGPEVISPFDHLKALRAGQFDIGITDALFFAEVRELQVHHYITYEKQVELMPQVFELFQKISREKADVVWLSCYSMGVEQGIWTTKKKLTTRADLSGLKIRTFGDTSIPLKKHLNIVPVNIPSQDLFSALQTGLVDGALRGMSNLDWNNEGEILKFGLPINSFAVSGDIFVSSKVWDKLPGDIRQLLNDCGREAEREALKTSYDRNREVRINIAKRFGATVVEPDPELKHLLEEVIPLDMIKILVEKSKYRDEITKTFKFGKLF